MRKSLIFIFFILLTSCYGSKLPPEVIKQIEEEDNNLCIMQGVEYQYKDTRETYWRCRLRIIDQRIANEPTNSASGFFYIKELKRIKKIIKNRLKKEREFAVAEIKNTLEEKEHNFCVMLKNTSNNTVDIYDYYKCREKINNLKKNNKSEYLIKISEYENEIEKPKNSVLVKEECIKYIHNKEQLDKCVAAEKEYNNCVSNINFQLNQRKIDDDVFCVKLSINKYPDTLSKFDDGKKTEDSNTIATFGPKINRNNLVDLREKEYQQCMENRKNKFISYSEYLKNECNKKSFSNIK